MEDFLNIVVLADEDGNEVELEYLDTIEYEDNLYAVMQELEDDKGEVVILGVDESTEEEAYYNVDDDAVKMAVFEIYKKSLNS